MIYSHGKSPMAGGKNAAGVDHQWGISMLQGSLSILFALTWILHTGGDVPYYEYENYKLCIPENTGV